jgi:hypothetical protein
LDEFAACFYTRLPPYNWDSTVQRRHLPPGALPWPVGYLDLEFDFSRTIPLQPNSYSFSIGVDLSLCSAKIAYGE